MKRATACLLACGLSGCAEHAPNPIEVAKTCITAQVPEGKKVSAAQAQYVIGSCAAQLDAWSKYSIEGQFKRPLDESNPQMMTALSKHRAASRTYWLAKLSDQAEPGPTTL